MNKPQPRIPQQYTDKIFALAAELQAEHEQSYSIAELKQIGQKPTYRQNSSNKPQSKFREKNKTVSTLLTLIVISIVYTFVDDITQGLKGLRKKRCSALSEEVRRI